MTDQELVTFAVMGGMAGGFTVVVGWILFDLVQDALIWLGRRAAHARRVRARAANA